MSAPLTSERLPHKIPRPQLMLLMQLMGKQPWLEKVEEALLDLLEFCETPDHQSLIADLLSRTAHLSERQFSGAIEQLGAEIEDVWKLLPSDTWVVSSNNKENTDSSQEVLNRLKAYTWRSLDWNKQKFLTRYADVGSKLKNGDTVVIVDDFIGTGRSIIKTINWFRKFALSNDLIISIRVCVVAGCMSGLAAVEATDVEVAFTHRLEKGISDHFVGADLVWARGNMKSLEDKLSTDIGSKNFSEYRFGYGASEAIYYRDGGNTPNNVFPIFWWRPMKTGARRTVMHRT